MPAIPDRDLIAARHLAAKAGSFLSGVSRGGADVVVAAAAPLSAWLTDTCDPADLRVRCMAAELHLENLTAVARHSGRSRSVTGFLDSARLYYAAFRGEEPPRPAPEVGEVGGRPEWTGRRFYALRNILLAATAPGTGGNAGGWERLRQSAARYGVGAEPPLTNSEYDEALRLLLGGDPRAAALGLWEVGRGRDPERCPSCGSADPATSPPRELEGRPWPCADSWHDGGEESGERPGPVCEVPAGGEPAGEGSRQPVADASQAGAR